ncbi:MAG: gluconokinase [Candidatus Ratteibacteria bacterium]
MENLILAVDVGTTNIKAGIINEEGKILRIITKEIEIEKDDKGKAEHNPERLFQDFISICRAVSIGYEKMVSYLVLSSYQFGLLPVDKDFKPLSGIITLLDLRPREIFKELIRKIEVMNFYKRVGSPPLFISPFNKIYWLKKKRKEIFKKARYFLGSKDYLLLRLLGKPYTEPSLSSATQLMNINNLKWDYYSLNTLGIEEKNLPEICSSEEIIGELTKEIRREIGLKRNVYVIPGVYDGGAIGLGIGAFEDTVGIMNIGTTAMLRITYPQPVIDRDKRMRFQAFFLCSNKWFIGGAINNAGIILKWFRDNIFNLSYDKLSSLAEEVETNNLYFFPFITGERYPEIGNIASGVLWGLRSFHTRNHMIRAAMEGVAYTLRMAFEALKENGIEMKKLRAGGGGTRSSVWMEIFSSVFNMPIEVTEYDEPGLLGLGLLVLYVTKRFNDLHEATKNVVKISKIYYPKEHLKEKYQKGYEFYKFLLKNFSHAFKKHTTLYNQ